MTEQTIDLDLHRGMAAQKATELRRLLSDVKANQDQLRIRQIELEEQLLAASALTWAEAAEKVRYLLSLFASPPDAQDPRRQMLISMLMTGSTDSAIANTLNLNVRSVRRWISELMEELGVTTRLQLGAALVRSDIFAPEPATLT